MSHHSSIKDEEMKRKMDEFLQRELGPTGQHPEGKLTASDDGEIKIAVGVDSGKVILHFGIPIEWIGLNPDQARDIAFTILDKAKNL